MTSHFGTLNSVPEIAYGRSLTPKCGYTTFAQEKVLDCHLAQLQGSFFGRDRDEEVRSQHGGATLDLDSATERAGVFGGDGGATGLIEGYIGVMSSSNHGIGQTITYISEMSRTTVIGTGVDPGGDGGIYPPPHFWGRGGWSIGSSPPEIL